MKKIKKYPKKTTIYNKIKLFFDEKGDKISYKDDLLYYLKLTNEDYINLESIDNKAFKLIKNAIWKLEIEYNLQLLNDKGGRVAYLQMKSKEKNIEQDVPIHISFSKEIREIK
ncbi:hypothetical protein [Spiroplasma melliferum]|uniref:hypothetical protein n=1 Tax=Spiroplasma melliferum TaxID=2134 RepID=UPI000C770B69|nr:hypothetical protein [Spiroplasma melliferum]